MERQRRGDVIGDRRIIRERGTEKETGTETGLAELEAGRTQGGRSARERHGGFEGREVVRTRGCSGLA